MPLPLFSDHKDDQDTKTALQVSAARFSPSAICSFQLAYSFHAYVPHGSHSFVPVGMVIHVTVLILRPVVDMNEQNPSGLSLCSSKHDRHLGESVLA